MSSKSLLLLGVALVGFIFLKNQPESRTSENYPLVKAELAHNLALMDVNSPEITPDSPDKIPDLANCPICKGSRVQVHADGHKTPCPYHGTTAEELSENLMNLSKMIAEMREEDEFYKHSLEKRLDVIDRVHIQRNETKPIVKPAVQQPNKSVITRTVANNCPCGCQHQVANCNCRSTCPGKQLPAYTQVVVNKPLMRKRMVCDGRSCYEVYEEVPQQQYNSPATKAPVQNWRQNRRKLLFGRH
jgi:hypothetical protein